ncbi:MAG: hypothetical protein JST75_12855 [Bacteroidetes bacterium]|nr:hypothetical protein [Bacteroidota bacterium]
MKKFLLFSALIVLFVSCGHKKSSTGGPDEIVDVNDFIKIFHSINLPYQFTDSIFRHHANDSTITNKTFHQFIPDSVLINYFGKTAKPKIYAVGRVSVKKSETYLFAKAIGASRKIFYVLCFDKDNKFTTSMPLINIDGEQNSTWISGMDAKYTISTTKQHKSAEGQILYSRWVYVYNDAGVFTLILTESNESKPKSVQLVINPIDTLPRKHKFTGDYIQDKRNFISFRDGKSSSHVLFFVHFEKDDGECKGELKGQAKFVSPEVAQYRANGDPCAIEFSFKENSVRMKELEGCGNHRDIKCFFDGSYAKHKETKSKPVKKKK